MRMQPFWGQQCERISVVSTTCERETERAAEQSKIQVVEALQDTGRWPFSHSKFLDFDHTLGYPSRFLSGVVRTVGESAGGVAQLGERLNGIQEVRGSIPLTSMAAWQRETGVCSRE